MKTIEFETTLTKEGTLTVPSTIAMDLPVDQLMRVRVLIGESESDQEWNNLALREMGEGYADSDAIYDQFSKR